MTNWTPYFVAHIRTGKLLPNWMVSRLGMIKVWVIASCVSFIMPCYGAPMSYWHIFSLPHILTATNPVWFYQTCSLYSRLFDNITVMQRQIGKIMTIKYLINFDGNDLRWPNFISASSKNMVLHYRIIFYCLNGLFYVGIKFCISSLCFT